MEKVKPVILMICDYYLPGFESGGAMRTLVNMVNRLSDTYQFKIVTRDHDGPLNRTSYTNVRINEWNQVENTDVFYMSKNSVRMGMIKNLVRETKPDSIYLNSFFSPLTVFTLISRKLNSIKPVPIILAPEGELVPGALSIKPLKKQLYVNAAKLFKLLDHVIWKAASEFEQDNIHAIYGNAGKVFIAPNLPPQIILGDFNLDMKPPKKRGQAKMVFLSRLMRKKNFKWLLDVVRSVKGDLTIDIYGPVEDAAYWEECQTIIKTLPRNIKIAAKGPVAHDDVAMTLSQYHFFVLPTLGENFGHIFIEALAAACPLVISDRSPWRDLEKNGIGWDIPLEKPEKWVSVVNNCLDMDNGAYRVMSEAARKFGVDWLCDPGVETANRTVLEFALDNST